MQRPIPIGAGTLGWPSRILAGAVGVLVLAVGFVFGLVVLGLATAAALGIGARLWWLGRSLRRGEATVAASSPRPGAYIEGEYQVLEEHRPRRKP
jgi:hypothetical protein